MTHNPRVEDWPVMPAEKLELHIQPGDFFTANPALDVPSHRNMSSVQVNGEKQKCHGGDVQQTAETHLQGSMDLYGNGVK